MLISKIHLSQTKQFPSLLLKYLQNDDSLKDFYQSFPDIKNFEKQIDNVRQTYDPGCRKALHETLTRQYNGLENFPSLQIDSLLHENTFTVTTGHQLNIFSGPLYVIYKLITVINLAKKLKKAYPHFNFIPVYWMATEDHDFAEINHFYLFGKKYTWETNQTGAVGEMKTDEIAGLFSQITEKLPLFEDAYLKQNSLADATRFWAHQLFGGEGLLCLDASDKNLKEFLKPIIKDDIFNNSTIRFVKSQSEKLAGAGFEPQVNGRDINFFYLDNGLRERIIKPGNDYEINNTDLKFSEEELNQLIENNPKKFSPNVLLRPVYQQIILPNLAYIGGPSEIAYWFQLKTLFEHYKASFPILMPRNFALYINKVNQKKIEKLGLAIEDLFLDENQLKNIFISRNVEAPLEINEEKELFEKIFENLLKKSLLVDASLEGYVKAERQKSFSSIENIEKRFKKAEEQKLSTQINQLTGLKSKLFPEGSLQERTDNFLNFYLNNPSSLQFLLDNFDPFNFDFNVVIEDEQ